MPAHRPKWWNVACTNIFVQLFQKRFRLFLSDEQQEVWVTTSRVIHCLVALDFDVHGVGILEIRDVERFSCSLLSQIKRIMSVCLPRLFVIPTIYIIRPIHIVNSP